MKVFLLTLVVLIGVNYASAQVDSAQALRAQAEANIYINSLKSRATFYRNSFKTALVTQANQLTLQMTSTKVQLAARFFTFGSKAQAQRAIWMGDIEDLISKLKFEFSSDSVDAILTPVMNQLRAAYIDLRYNELEDLKTAINAHKTLVACWDNNDKVIKSLTDKLIAQTKTIIEGEINDLKSFLIATTSNINSIGDVFNNDLKGCKSDDVCGYNYIKLNYCKLLCHINKETSAASKEMKTSIGRIYVAVRAAADAIFEEYTNGPLLQIQQCLAVG